MIALLWIGCHDGDDGDAHTGDPTPEPTTTGSCAGPITFTIGAGSESMTPVQSGGDFPIDPRGGAYMLLPLAGALTGTGPHVSVAGTVTRVVEGDVISVVEPSAVALDGYADCAGVFFGVPAVIEMAGVTRPEMPCVLDGAALQLDITVLDLDGCDGQSCGQIQQTLEVVGSADTSDCA